MTKFDQLALETIRASYNNYLSSNPVESKKDKDSGKQNSAKANPLTVNLDPSRYINEHLAQDFIEKCSPVEKELGFFQIKFFLRKIMRRKLLERNIKEFRKSSLLRLLTNLKRLGAIEL